MEFLSQHVRVGTEKNHEQLSEQLVCHCKDSNQVPPEYECGALPLFEPALSSVLRGHLVHFRDARYEHHDTARHITLYLMISYDRGRANF